jgi:GNAT superfamily N-acetyltransferase
MDIGIILVVNEFKNKYYKYDSLDFNMVLDIDFKDCLEKTIEMKDIFGHRIGYAEFTICPNYISKILNFRIIDKYQSFGFGKLLYGEIEKVIKDYSVIHIIIDSLQESVGFWCKMGFEESLLEGNNILMEKRL